MSRPRLAAIACAGAAALVGCETTSRETVDPPEVTEPLRAPAPSYADIAERFNSNSEGLDRLWARTTVVVDTTGAEGKRVREQGEGHLQWIRPDRLALSIGKLGEEGFYLGSNESSYWWLDLVNDERVAVIGSHALADDRAIDGFGLPVHPLDLAELLGLAPLPDSPWDAGQIVPQAPTAWAGDGRLVSLDKPTRSGRAHLLIDPETGWLERVTLTDARGRAVATSALSRYKQAEMIQDGGDWPWIATRVALELRDPDDPAFAVDAVLSLYAAENRGSRQKEIPFDLERLVRAYKIDRIVDLDERASGG